MALNAGGFLFTVLVVLAATAELVGHAAAATYVVGDSFGWRVPSTGSATYTAWASQHVFQVGDVLVFNFSTGQHNVAHVTKGEFDGCSSTNPIALLTAGPANITLNSMGADYYICTVGPHCSLGQKLAINVTASSATPVPAPAPAPVAPSPTTPTPTTTPSPSPTPGSMPSPTPSGGVAPPLSPASEMSPGLAPPAENLSPPPAPNVATLATISSPLVIFASVAFGFMI